MKIIINPVVKRQPYMNVSTVSNGNGKSVYLNLYRIFEGLFDAKSHMYQKIRYGDHHGKEFSSHDEAMEFAFDRGYLTHFNPR